MILLSKILVPIFLLCLCFPADAGRYDYLKGSYISDPCGYLSGTYELGWGGEYSGDTDKACLDSGSSNADATEATAGVIVVGGAITGSYGALLDAANERIRYAGTSETIDTEGWVKFSMVTPSSFSGDSMLFEIYTDADNNIVAYFSDATDAIYWRHEGATTARGMLSSASSVTVSTTYNGATAIIITWSDSGSKQAISFDNGSTWDTTDTNNLVPFGGTVDNFCIGDYSYGGTINGSWKVDNVYFGEGYIGP